MASGPVSTPKTSRPTASKKATPIATLFGIASKKLIDTQRRGYAERRADLMRFFDAHGFVHTASVSNKLMVDARMPAAQELPGCALLPSQPQPCR